MDLLRALAVLAEPPSPEHQGLGKALELGALPSSSETSELFLFQLPPFSSIYLGGEGMLGGSARELVAGFWRALGEPAPEEPDHLTTLLGLYTRLVELESDSADTEGGRRWRHARRALFWEHLASWLPAYLVSVERVAPPFYRRWSRLLAKTLEKEARELGLPEAPPLLLREATPPADPRRDGGEAFLASLLSPARSGLVLTQSDLERGAGRLRLGLRRGERRFVLRSLLGQEAEATLGWLAEEAAAWSDRHRRHPAALQPVAEHWLARSQESRSLLQELRAELPAGAL